MPVLHISHSPRMTKEIVASQVFAQDQFRLVDVGARGGVESVWKVFGDQLSVVGFEADEEECARLNASSGDAQKFLPVALGGANGPRKYFRTRLDGMFSFFPINTAFSKRFLGSENLESMIEASAEMRTFDEVARTFSFGIPDFIKLDVDGAEYEVLTGSSETLRQSSLLGLVVEVRFQKELIDCPVFSDIDTLLREKKFQLFDLDVYRHSRKALPYPLLYDFRSSRGAPVDGPTVQGQAMWGDALYLRDLVALANGGEKIAPVQALKMACLLEIFGLNDCAAELLLHFREMLSPFIDVERMLDLLVTPVDGKDISYHAYQKLRVTEPERFRPRSGLRYPDPIWEQFDPLLCGRGNSQSLAARIFRKLKKRASKWARARY